ncbi:hypothetical protein BD809_104136 [Aquimarina intermedia]|uniref:Outer membrane protein with beta-barrel domain n=2 Tax=Aquimarina intermedia TaxID=350814 RepID=A0A5S5C7E5_9FLAO|nr:hypothetical protein BD809_104136 [Aquimarina intermedia]
MFLYTVAFLVSPIIAVSQNDENKNKSYLLLDVSYMSDAVFMGRRDSIATPYLYSSVGYYDKSGFYANASLSYLTRSDEGRVDLSLITAGYEYTHKGFTAEISGTAYFFDEDSYNVQSQVVADLTGSLGYDFTILELLATGSSYFNNNSGTDIFVGLHLNRTFYVLSKKLSIMPSVNLYAGSQYFYEEYYRNNRQGNGNRGGQGSGDVNSYIVDIKKVDKFNILSYELSIPLHYFYKSFVFSFTPGFAFPQSRATITTEEQTFKEDLNNTFYWSVGINYWLYTKKRK